MRPWAALALVAAIIAGTAVALGGNGGRPLAARTDGERPVLLLLTSLPLLFAEDFGLEAAGSPALTALERRYRVVPIGVADAASLKGHRLLLMAQPLAQPAEALVDLDSWVRAGGRLVLLADPMLDWPSKRPLGDKFRPPIAFADTGLLNHWRLTLHTPDRPGPAQAVVDRRRVTLSSPGVLAGACGLRRDGLMAQCAIAKGHATVIADADFLRVDDADSENLQFLLAELDRIERR